MPPAKDKNCRRNVRLNTTLLFMAV